MRERSRRGGARRRTLHPRRLLRSPVLARTTDRVEDLVAWLLVALGIVAALGAVVVGVVTHREALLPGRLGDVTPVRVMTLADAPPAAGGPEVPQPEVPVSWTAADGVEHTGELVMAAPVAAGTSTTAWLDRQGRLTSTAPRHTVGALAFGVGATLAAGALAWALLAGLWAGVRRAAEARNDAAWTREWARVEPVWSRQVR